jgi:hypothetical protein
MLVAFLVGEARVAPEIDYYSIGFGVMLWCFLFAVYYMHSRNDCAWPWFSTS